VIILDVCVLEAVLCLFCTLRQANIAKKNENIALLPKKNRQKFSTLAEKNYFCSSEFENLV
jgi:hypothetical protein